METPRKICTRAKDDKVNSQLPGFVRVPYNLQGQSYLPHQIYPFTEKKAFLLS